jgi:hypothetical protein
MKKVMVFVAVLMIEAKATIITYFEGIAVKN